MTSAMTRILTLVAIVCVGAQAVNLNRGMLGMAGSTLSMARNNYNWPADPRNECGHNIYATLQSIADRPIVAQNKLSNWLNHSCLYDDGYPRVEGILNQWHQLGMECLPINPDFPPSSGEINAWQPWFFVWRLENSWHGGVFIPELPGKYGARNDLEGENGVFDFLGMMKQRQGMQGNGVADCFLFRLPNNKLNNCNSVKFNWGFDSTINFFKIRHNIYCCWKEKLTGEEPWTTNPSPYACLNWDASNGQTWDTLISQRANLAGCTSVVFVQSCTTNLARSGNTIKILGSTDDGANWDYTVGTDTTKRAVLGWAVGERDVRLAWVYHGDVQEKRFWCVDDAGLWTKPALDRDVALTEIWRPQGTLSQGMRIVPTAFVWNCGRAEESIPVTFEIDGLPIGSTFARLQPVDDTVLEFPTWIATPGTHTARCYASIPGDEVPQNDTATLTFSVVSDDWVKMCEIYGGHSFGNGACLATVDTENIYCAPDWLKFYATYIVSKNLWNTCAPTPKNFSNGAGLTYPGSGDLLYAVKGTGKQFYAYSITCNTWDTLPEAPFTMGAGGALAYGGDGCVYALRGNKRKNFSRYNITETSWQTRQKTLDKISSGGSLVWTRGDSMYALRGGGYPDFYRYLTTADTWVRLQSLPVNVAAGGALAYYPPGNKIFAFVGGVRDSFYVYDIQANSWTRRHSAPDKVRVGGKLAYCNYAIYGGLGYRSSKDLWRYSPPSGGLLSAGGDDGESVEAAASWTVPADGTPGSRLDPRELLTFDPTDKHAPQYSPDGIWIAYTAYDSVRDCNGLYLIPAGGGPGMALSPDSLNYEDPDWAGNGGWLVAAADDGIYKISLGMPPLRLAEGIVSTPQVSEGDSWVIYERWDPTARSHHVHKVRSIGTGDTCLTPGTSEYLEPRSVSDSAFACVKLKDEVYQLARDSAGQESWLTSDYLHNAGLDVSPDGQWLTYMKLDESGFWQVYKMRVNGTEETRVTDGICDCETPVFSPNGQYIAYTRWPVDSTSSSEFSQVCYSDVNIPGGWVALHDADAERENPCWSPNCQYIIYEKLVESSAPSLAKKEKHKQIGRARTRIRSLDGVQALSDIPRVFALYQNRPNPFGRATTIRYALPVTSLAELSIYDVTGRTVTRLVQSEQKRGYYSVVWNGKDMRGRSVAAGTYFYVLKSNGKIAQKRMLLVR